MARRIGGEWLTRDLALTDVENTVTLSGPGSITGNLPPEVNRVLQPDRARLAEDWATMIYAVNDAGTRCINHGIVLPPTEYDDAARITCAGVSVYPQGYIYTDSKFWGPQAHQKAKKNKKGKVVQPAIPYKPHPDPIEVYRELWRWIQNQAHSDLGVKITGATDTGKRPRPNQEEPVVGLGSYSDPYRLRYYETPDVGGEMDTFAELTPFDYREQVDWDWEEPEHQIELGYPRLGRKRTDLRLAMGENIALAPTVSTSAAAANMLIGVGNGDAGPRMVYERLPWNDGRLRRHRVVTDKTASEKGMKRRLEMRREMFTQGFDVTSVALVDHPNARISQLQLGDDVRVLAEHPEFGLIDTWVRILSITRGENDDAAVLTTSASAFFTYKATEELS